MTPRVVHPGPVGAERVTGVACRVYPASVRLPAGAALIEAARAAPAAWLRFSGPMAPMHYVIPAEAPDAGHAAWYSATHAPRGGGQVLQAGLFTGPRAGAAFLHCHGGWDVAAGPRAGHLLPHDAHLAVETVFEGWRIAGARMQAAPDAETNFTLYRPEAVADSATPESGRRAVLARVAPNVEIGAALAGLCAAHGLAAAQVEGIGSLIGAQMADGSRVPPGPTEVLIRTGRATPAGAQLDILLVDRFGAVTEGALAPTGNPVFVTFEVVLIEN